MPPAVAKSQAAQILYCSGGDPFARFPLSDFGLSASMCSWSVASVSIHAAAFGGISSSPITHCFNQTFVAWRRAGRYTSATLPGIGRGDQASSFASLLSMLLLHHFHGLLQTLVEIIKSTDHFRQCQSERR